VSKGFYSLIFRAAQNVDDVASTEALTCPEDTRKRFTGIFSGIKSFGRRKTDVAISAIMFNLFAKIAEKHPTPATLGFCKSNHSIEFVCLNADLIRIVAGFYKPTRYGNISVTEEQQGI
jgi:hypothetical protein